MLTKKIKVSGVGGKSFEPNFERNYPDAQKVMGISNTTFIGLIFIVVRIWLLVIIKHFLRVKST